MYVPVLRRVGNRRLTSLIALVGLALLAPIPTPAWSDHANNRGMGGHWGNHYAPPVGYCYINSDRTANVQDGAYYWQDTFFPQGYNPPLPRATYTSGNIAGWINSCELNYGHPALVGRRGQTYWGFQCDTACNHIRYATVYVANLSNAVERQQVWRHEMGHAIGLGHTRVDWRCVMWDGGEPPLGSRCDHDRAALHEMYDHGAG